MHQINYFWEAFNGFMNLGVIGSQFSDCSQSLWTHPIANIFVVGSNVVGCWSILSLRESEEMNGAPLFCVCNCDNYKFLWDITVNKKYYQLGRPNIKHNTPAPGSHQPWAGSRKTQRYPSFTFWSVPSHHSLNPDYTALSTDTFGPIESHIILKQ